MNREPSFGVLVKERRQALGLTQTELGRRAGCAAITIRKIEADALRPSVQIAENLALALHIAEAEQLNFVRMARIEREPTPIPTPPPMPEEIGREDLSGRAVRGFQLAERIGTGGYGAVYRAVQTAVDREVAVKIILPRYADRPEFIRRFEAEAQLVARLEHPHIVPLYDYWREPGVAFLVMRYLRGGSLETRVRQGPLSHETILPLLEQVCAGLHAAHRAGVIHRDIKPANILIDDDGNAYLADFGIAKYLDNSDGGSLTQGDVVIGSPAYISPEQILSEPVKPQTDIYSLGVMLYELLTGRKPFKGPTPIAYIQQHLNQPLPLLSDSNGGDRTPPTALDIVIGRATAKDSCERYPNVPGMLADIRRAMTPGCTAADLTAEITPPHVAAMLTLPEMENPFKGLRPFGEADAADFFGRDTLVQTLLERLGETGDLVRFLAVVGPSGSGKSSVVKAGLIPALRQGGLPNSEKWFITEMIPGPHPSDELEAALLRVAVNPPDTLREQLQADERGLLRAVNRILPPDETTELVLVVDQFEELFTLVDDKTDRAHFLDAIVTAVLDPRSRLRVIITLRADFTDRPLQYSDFGELLRHRTEFVLPLIPDELEQAITGPTRRAGLALETGLTSAIVNEIGDQPGMLPLLQYALTELFERREGRKLTLSAYRTSGGVSGALARRADELYDGLNDAGRQAVRRLFMRLVTLGENTEDTRRRVLRSEIGSSDGAGTEQSRSKIPVLKSEMDAVIDRFGKHRLLTFDRDPITREPTIEVAHEALIREWKRLRGWLDEDREFLLWGQRLRFAMRQWQDSDQDKDALLRGAPLAEAEGWLAERREELSRPEQAFIEAGLDLRRRKEMEREQEHLAREKLRRRIIWGLAAGLALAVILLLLAAGLSVYAFNQQNKAEANQAQAESNLALSESQRLAAEAVAILQGGGDAELATLLSLQALNTTYTPQADMALQQASKEDFGRQLLTGHIGPVMGLVISPDGRYALSGSCDGDVRLWDLGQEGQLLRTFTTSVALWDVALSPDGAYVLTGNDDGIARLFDVSTGQERTLTGHTNSIESVAFSPDGVYALTGSWDGTARLWEVKTGREVRRFAEGEGVVASVTFSPDGQQILTGNWVTNEVHLWSVATGQIVQRFTGSSGGIISVNFSPDGRYILAGDLDGMVRVWDLQQVNAEPRLFAGSTEGLLFQGEMSFSSDGRFVLWVGGSVSLLWDFKTGQEVRRFAHVSSSRSSAFSPDGWTVLIGTDDGAIRIWDIQPPPDPRTLSGHTGQVQSVKFSPDGRYILTGSSDQTARLWETATGRELRVFRGHTDSVFAAVFSPDGRYVLTSGNLDKTARLWDVETGREVRVFTHTNAVHGIVFSPDGRYLLSGSAVEGAAWLWEVETGLKVRQFPNYGSYLNGIAFSPDGNYILTAAGENSTQLWDLRQEGESLANFSGENVAFSPDGKYIVTGGLKTAYLWDRVTGRQLRAFGVDKDLWAVAISPDSRYILIGSTTQTAQLWDTDSHTLIDSVCARVLRDLTAKEWQQYFGDAPYRLTCPNLPPGNGATVGVPVKPNE